jgi:hypothetical protein
MVFTSFYSILKVLVLNLHILPQTLLLIEYKFVGKESIGIMMMVDLLLEIAPKDLYNQKKYNVISSLHIGPVIGYNIYKRNDPLETENLGK